MKKKFFIGIDVGGTKISLALVNSKGKIILKDKIPTPYKASSQQIVKVIAQLIRNITKQAQAKNKKLAGIGIGIPGIVDSQRGVVVSTPNINLSGCNLSGELKKIFDLPVLIGNDVNLGLLGEYWLGAAAGMKDVLGLFPGTGVGGAIIINGKIIEGVNGAASEFGHMLVEENGPKCNCGNYGCLEALTSRWAIERDIRKDLALGKKTILTKLTNGDLRVIKSKLILQALKDKDPVVSEIIAKVAKVLGRACISLRHIFDCQAIVFGGGLIEACSNYILPGVIRVVNADPFFSKLPPLIIASSQLEDDAVILGAVALVKEYLKDKLKPQGKYPILQLDKNLKVVINDKRDKASFYIRSDGKVKKSKDNFFVNKKIINLNPKDLEKICSKKTKQLIIGGDKSITLNSQTQASLRERDISCHLLTIEEAINRYNQTTGRKAIMIIQ